jgi:hypothetical protein
VGAAVSGPEGSDRVVAVTVEGADPEAVDLQIFVAGELERRGYGSIRVRTEW